ncbi:hypothetical protein J6590_001760 [Homalodisca vitripennis]|nr:hypothetical protein J6590_001760 [Homalodisca vitripennis]
MSRFISSNVAPARLLMKRDERAEVEGSKGNRQLSLLNGKDFEAHDFPGSSRNPKTYVRLVMSLLRDPYQKFEASSRPFYGNP